MATFSKNKLSLVTQAIAGPKLWYYTDTGLLIADVNEVEGFFDSGYACGMRHGDRIMITEGDTGAYDTGNANTGGRRQYTGTVLKVQDTGTTRVTVGLTVLVGDTS
jgi:hypothetical protein